MGWLSGSALKPLGPREVAEIALGPIIAGEGIVGWQDVVEYAMVGVTAFQLCTAVIWHGFELGSQLRDGLQKFLAR